jgi:hypothetical protein
VTFEDEELELAERQADPGAAGETTPAARLWRQTLCRARDRRRRQGTSGVTARRSATIGRPPQEMPLPADLPEPEGPNA